MKKIVRVLLLLFTIFPISNYILAVEQSLEHETQKKDTQASIRNIMLYAMDADQGLKDITGNILASKQVSNQVKKTIIASKRRFFIFCYPSLGNKVLGYISFTHNHQKSPMLILLRDGTGLNGLMNPVNDFTCLKDYTVISTVYQGGISEGKDEWGGNEVCDVFNMMEYLPLLSQKLQTEFHPSAKYIVGLGRGAVDMILALARYPTFQRTIKKAVSISGPLDLDLHIQTHPKDKELFITRFGLKPGVNDKAWISYRSPMTNIAKLNSTIPFLVVQGAKDRKVYLQEGINFVRALLMHKKMVEYKEIEGGDHCLENQPERASLIAEWLEKDSHCYE